MQKRAKQLTVALAIILDAAPIGVRLRGVGRRCSWEDATMAVRFQVEIKFEDSRWIRIGDTYASERAANNAFVRGGLSVMAEMPAAWRVVEVRS